MSGQEPLPPVSSQRATPSSVQRNVRPRSSGHQRQQTYNSNPQVTMSVVYKWRLHAASGHSQFASNITLAQIGTRTNIQFKISKTQVNSFDTMPSTVSTPTAVSEKSIITCPDRLCLSQCHLHRRYRCQSTRLGDQTNLPD